MHNALVYNGSFMSVLSNADYRHLAPTDGELCAMESIRPTHPGDTLDVHTMWLPLVPCPTRLCQLEKVADSPFTIFLVVVLIPGVNNHDSHVTKTERDE